MKLFSIFGAALVSAFVPIPIGNQIQFPPTPTPAPSEAQIVRDLADFLRNQAATASDTVNTAVLLLGVGFVFLIVVVILFTWKVAAPMLAAWNADRVAREEAVKSERTAREAAQTTSSDQLSISNERERVTQALRTRQAEALERVVVTMNENDKNQEQRYTDLKTSINTNTNAQVTETKDAIMKELKDIRDSLSDDKPGLGFRIAHVETLLTSLLETKTSPLAPAVPASVNGDTPLSAISSETP